MKNYPPKENRCKKKKRAKSVLELSLIHLPNLSAEYGPSPYTAEIIKFITLS